MNTHKKPVNRSVESNKLIAQFYDFIEANKAADGIDDIEDAVLQTTWVFLSKWQKAKVAFKLLRQSFC